MANFTRRAFLARTSLGAGMAAAAATGALALASRAWSGGARATVPARPVEGPVPENLIVHVRDVERAEVSLMAGTDEVVYRDPALVAGLLQAARRAGTGR